MFNSELLSSLFSLRFQSCSKAFTVFIFDDYRLICLLLGSFLGIWYLKRSQTSGGGQLMKDSEKHWLVRAKTIKILWIIFSAILALTVVSELFIHKHEYFGIDGSFGFSAWYGFITCVAMVVGAKLLGFFLKRKEDYYDD